MELYYPPLGFHFRVSFELPKTTSEDFNFQSVSGLTSEVVTETYREGGQNQYDHELPVKTQYPDLVLKRGLWIPPGGASRVFPFIGGVLTPDHAQQWMQQMMQSLIVQPTDLNVTLLSPAGEKLMRWNIKRAWPKKWMVSDFNAEDNQVVIETMELHYDYYTLG